MSMKGFAMICEVSTTDPEELARWQRCALDWGLSHVATVNGRVTTLVLLCPVQERPDMDYEEEEEQIH
jgi:hypothetical protein